MANEPEIDMALSNEMLAAGRRHLAVRDYSAAVEVLAEACELLASDFGESADQCAEAYLWYGKALLGLSREESGVLGDGVTRAGKPDDDDDDDEADDDDSEAQTDNGESENNDGRDGDVDEDSENTESGDGKGKTEIVESESNSCNEEPAPSKEQGCGNEPGRSEELKEDTNQPGTSNGEQGDESAAELPDEEDVDNLQLAWEMLEMSRRILKERGAAAHALLADAYLALGEVALESETYDKAITEMQNCLELQKELYQSDDRRIAETHYQIGLANSLASNFEVAITHFKNAANILETRIKTLEDPASATKDETVKKFAGNDPFYSVEGEVKELKELLPEIREKIQDMMDCKAETIKRMREALCPSNGASSSSNGSGPATAAPRQASDISHLIKRKRKSTEEGDAEGSSAPKRANT